MAVEADVEGKPAVIYVPDRILSPLTMFAYWCALRGGQVPGPDQVKVVQTAPAAASTLGPDYVQISSFRAGGRAQLQQWAQKSPQPYKLTKLVNYFSHCLPDQKLPPLATLERIGASAWVYGLLVMAAIELWHDPQLALQGGVQVLDQLLAESLDPFQAGKGEPEGEMRSRLVQVARWAHSEMTIKWERLVTEASSGVKVEIVIPTRDEAVVVQRQLGRIRLLQGEKVSVALVGPAGSGKSTATANLKAAAEFFLEQVHHVDEFWSVVVPVKAGDFDVSTPDLVRISRGETASFSAAQKVPWTPSAASERVRDFLSSTGGVHFVSTPGGRPDEITRILTLPLDTALLVIREEDNALWAEKRREWGEALAKSGLTQAALIRSRRPGEKSRTGQVVESSTLTRVSWRQLPGFAKKDWLTGVGGRLVGARRQIEPDDGFYRDLARLLLLDILPGLVVVRHRQAMDYVNYMVYNLVQ